MTKYKAPTDYSREAIIYTIAFSITFSFLILNTQTHLGMFFEVLIAGVLMLATGLAALVAIALTFFRPIQRSGRRVALACFVVLIAYPTASILIWP